MLLFRKLYVLDGSCETYAGCSSHNLPVLTRALINPLGTILNIWIDLAKRGRKASFYRQKGHISFQDGLFSSTEGPHLSNAIHHKK